MRTIKASEFKAKCLQLMDEVAATGQPLVITKRGLPVSVMSPYTPKAKSLFGLHRGATEILGDVVSPLDEPWDVDR